MEGPVRKLTRPRICTKVGPSLVCNAKYATESDISADFLVKKKSPSDSRHVGWGEHSPPSGREAIDLVRGSSAGLLFIPGTMLEYK